MVGGLVISEIRINTNSNNMTVSHLTRAKVAKNDEFYTRREDVEKELIAYLEEDPALFRGKVVYLPADRASGEHPSAFWEYFRDNFQKLGLSRLIATCKCLPGDPEGKGYHSELLREEKTGAILEYHGRLEGDGDFRNYEMVGFFHAADFVITNPPYSRLKELAEVVHLLNKRFLLVVPIFAFLYRRLFQLIWRGEAWLGATKIRSFRKLEEDGTLTDSCNSAYWWTNLYHSRGALSTLPELRTQAENEQLLAQRKEDDPLRQRAYKMYDNYDAIEVPRCILIPSDYKGLIGVPVTILEKLVTPKHKPCRDAKENRQEYTPPTAHLTHEAWRRLLTLKNVNRKEYGIVESRAIDRKKGKRKGKYCGVWLGGEMLFHRVIVELPSYRLVGFFQDYKIPSSEEEDRVSEQEA